MVSDSTEEQLVVARVAFIVNHGAGMIRGSLVYYDVCIWLDREPGIHQVTFTDAININNDHMKDFQPSRHGPAMHPQ